MCGTTAKFCLTYLLSVSIFNNGFAKAEVSLGKFNLFTNSGWPRHNITSEDVELLDTRRIAIRGLALNDEEPSAFWSVRLKSAPNGTRPPLDQLGKYRDNIILSDPLIHNPGCGYPMNIGGKERDVILTLPKEYTWNDVAWLGIYSYSYTYVLNYIWISHLPNGLPRKMPVLPDGTEDLVTDPMVCNRTLTPCTTATPGLEEFCYRRCEDIPENDERFHCGDKLRNDGKLFGCVGIRSVELKDGEKLPARECIPETTLQNRIDNIQNLPSFSLRNGNNRLDNMQSFQRNNLRNENNRNDNIQSLRSNNLRNERNRDDNIQSLQSNNLRNERNRNENDSIQSLQSINLSNEISILTVPSVLLLAPEEPGSGTGPLNAPNRFRAGRYSGPYPRVRPYRFRKL